MMENEENKMTETKLTGYPSIDKPWLKYYTEEAIQAPLPTESLYTYMYNKNRDHLSETAMTYFGRKISFGQMFDQIDLVARAFRAQGVKPGDVCTIVTVSCVTSVLCQYALNKIGAVSNYINVLSSQEDLEAYFKDADSRIVVTLDLFAEKVITAAKQTGVERVVSYSLGEWMPPVTKFGFQMKMRKMDKSWVLDSIVMQWNDFLTSAEGQPDFTYEKDCNSVCCLAHTGGTTGFPKTVLISDQAMNILAQQYDNTIIHKRQQVLLSVMIPFVIYGNLTNIHMPLCLGLNTVLIPKFEADQWPSYIRKYRPNHIAAIPPYVAAMLDNEKLAKEDLSCLITVGLGGDGMNTALENKLNIFLAAHNSSAKVVKGYGMTEVCASWSSCNNYHNKVGSVGFPFPTNNVMIYDNHAQNELGYSEVGEICLQSASRMIGYKDNEEEMRNLIRIHPDGSEWIHSGDLGYVDEDGFLFLVGRMKRIILTSSDGVTYKVYPNIPEEVLVRHAAVHSVCIVGEKKDNDLVLRAHVILNPEMQTQKDTVEQELRKLCEEQLSDYSRPYYYTFRETFPRTAAGKVDYRALEREAQREMEN